MEEMQAAARQAASAAGDAVTEIRSGDLITALDEASLSRFHLRAVLASGVGFFTDAYDLPPRHGGWPVRHQHPENPHSRPARSARSTA